MQILARTCVKKLQIIYSRLLLYCTHSDTVHYTSALFLFTKQSNTFKLCKE